MQKVIENLLQIIAVQKQLIIYLCFLAFGKDFKAPNPDKITDKKYLKLAVDPLPVFEKTAPKKIYDHIELIATNNIKPIKRRGNKCCAQDLICPYCGANHLYIYNNNPEKSQFSGRWQPYLSFGAAFFCWIWYQLFGYTRHWTDQ